MQCPWGQKAFPGYLGPDRAAWAEYDACELMRSRGSLPASSWSTRARTTRSWWSSSSPSSWRRRREATGQPLTLRWQAGYDHGYYFIQTFVADHVAHHAQALGAG